jgi:hypothetical protein
VGEDAPVERRVDNEAMRDDMLRWIAGLLVRVAALDVRRREEPSDEDSRSPDESEFGAALANLSITYLYVEVLPTDTVPEILPAFTAVQNHDLTLYSSLEDARRGQRLPTPKELWAIHDLLKPLREQLEQLLPQELLFW